MKEILLLLVMFWNVENYFDTYDNPTTADDEFTPKGEKFWTRRKFEKKRDDLARTIMLAAEQYGVFPALLGLCEVENRYVLEQLVNYTPLARVGYKYIHKDSPDNRGIDVALLYREEVFHPLERNFYPLLQGGDTLNSRYILHIKGVVGGLDTVEVFVNHWPSKLGGERASLHKRMIASNLVKQRADSILKENPDANILLMGDFNDTPESEPLKNLNKFINLSRWSVGGEGTHKYRESWEFIDQILISENLMWEEKFVERKKWIYIYPRMDLFAPQFLLQRDETYLGERLRKTYNGPRYLGGVSDHLPIIIKIFSVGY